MKNNCKENTKSNNECQLELYQLSKRFFKWFLILFFAYCLGYLGFSVLWILIGVFVWTLRLKYFKEQTERVKFMRSIAIDEKQAIRCAIKDLPSWVHFPDTERSEWINKIIKQIWPFIHQYVKTLIKETIEPNITSTLPDYMKGLRFDKIDLGSIPLRIGSVKCYDENTSRNEIILDIDIVYAGNSDFQFRFKGMKAGVRDFQLYGKIRVELRPLLKDLPLVGSLSFYFLNSPAIEFNLTNLADILDFPGIGDYLRQAIKEQLAALMVFPNKFVFPLINELSMKSIKFLEPMGVVRIEVIEARNLKKSDVGMLGLGKSDPYVRVMVGSHEFKSQVIYNTVNPKWDYICEAIVYHFHGQSIEIEVMDEDQGSKDDFLGRTSLSLNTISSDGFTETWLTLSDTKTGAIHVKNTWFALSDCIEDIKDSIEESESVKQQYIEWTEMCDNRPFGSVIAILIYLDGAKRLPAVSQTDGEPDPYCIIRVDKQKKQSIVKNSTPCPVWEETFSFLVDSYNPNLEIVFELKDSKTNRYLGTAKLKLQEVISCKNLSFNQPLTIRGRTSESELNTNVIVRVLKSQRVKQKERVLIKEPIDKYDERDGVPTLEDMIRGTVQPIIDTSGLNRDVIEKSQNDRKHLLINGSKSLENIKLTEDLKESKKYPRIQLSIKKSESDEKINITLHRAENLPKTGYRKPDPFVKIYQIPDNPSRTLREIRLKSQTKRNTCNPIFDQNFEMKSDINGQNGLEVVVYSRNYSSSFLKRNKNKMIGLASVESSALDRQMITEWFDLEQIND